MTLAPACLQPDIEELALHKRPYLIATTPETVEWPIRWGETRVLPELLKTLPETQLDHLLAPVRCWCSAGREGELIRLEQRCQWASRF